MTQGKLVGCKVLQYCDVVLNYTTYYLNLWTWTSPLPVNNLLLQPVNMNISSSCEQPTTSTCEHEHLLFLWTTYYLNLWTWTSPLPVNNLLPQPVNMNISSSCEQPTTSTCEHPTTSTCEHEHLLFLWITYYFNLWTWTSPLPVNNLLPQPVNMNISSSCEHEHLLFLWTTYYLNLWTSYYLNLWTWTSPLPVNNLLPQPVNISFCEQLAMPLLLGWSTQITWDSPLCQQVVIPVGM